jgi:hypothetical protein
MEAPWIRAEKETEAKFGCECAKNVFVYVTMTDGRKQHRLMCIRCGELKPNAVSIKTLTPREVDQIPEFDDSRRTDWRRKKMEYRQALIERYGVIDREGREGYYQTPEWKEKTRLVRDRSGGVCEGCRKRPAVACHHLTYDHLGDEFLWELADVCDSCHKKAHPQHQSAVGF